MPREPFRVVYDCNVFWRAFFYRKGTGYECRRLIDSSRIIHFVSPETVAELIDVLSREETIEKFPQYSLNHVSDFVKEIVSQSTLVKNIPPLVELPRDVDDEPYLNLAISVNAAYLVSTDRDLLDLMTGIDTESKQFRQRFRHLRIVRPDKFLRIVLDRGLSLDP